MRRSPAVLFFFNDTATPEIYPLSLHDALPISLLQLVAHSPGHRGHVVRSHARVLAEWKALRDALDIDAAPSPDRKSTRLNSSHVRISYDVFCLKKKKKTRRGVLFYCSIDAGFG